MNAHARSKLEEAVLAPLAALLVALVAGDLLMLAYGQSPSSVWRMLLEGTWGNAYGFGQVLYKTTTLACTGLAVAVPMRAGLFNIGAEGQLAAGGFVLEVGEHLLDQHAQRRGLPPHFLPADAGQVEQVIHEHAHLRRAGANILQVTLRSLR